MPHPMTETSLDQRALAREDRAHLNTTYAIEGLLSFAANLLFVGIFFYTTKVFGWDLLRNFLLAAAQGAVYIAASLTSQKLAAILGGRRLLLFANVALAAVSLVGVFSSHVTILIAVIILYVPLMGLNWPVLEAAAAANADPHTMSRRIGLYNLIWAGTGALAVAVQGTILRIDPRGVFLLPLLIHVAIVIWILVTRGYGDSTQSTAAAAAHPHLDPEPELLRQRTLALWLSRIALPSTYVVIYGVSALMPLLPTVKALDTAAQTAVGSVWMISRFATFGLLGATVFWHTRPRLLLAAAVLMGAAFVGVTRESAGLPMMIAAQVLLGAALGLIYTASLYFGMVLSDASPEHAGYHEALIGVGQVLGPTAGALTQWAYPGSIPAGATAVSALVAISLVAASIAAAKAVRAESRYANEVTSR